MDPDPLKADIELRSIASGFVAPLLVTNAGDGSGRLFVVEQGGTIRTITAKGRVAKEPFLDVSSLIVAGGEQGLLGLAFEPDFADSGRFYIDYTDTDGNTVVARYRISDDPSRADPSSAEVILRVEQPFPNHNGGHLAFGPDGYLYVGLGDGGGGGDPEGNGQNTDTLLASILRLDVSTPTAYDIPEDNPFAGGGGRPEIWAWGLRNPWRFTFDRATGAMWIGDVGQDEIEEIDFQLPGVGGLNYGWNVMEGDACFGTSSCNKGGLEPPVAQYTHEQGCSVTGGHVYRGERYPVLAGGYFFADYCTGFLWVIEARNRVQEPTLKLETGRSISSFGESESGELFLVDIAAGELLQVTGKRP
ncbi:MAG: PQQ-dependent sugar dehydrogenase [Actinobacteria bacterium]|nr:PQQ-dependent sugar dehydrogenase [Actinomycetota bacterium]